MAILGEIPRRPGDRSLEALWAYVEALEEGVRHMGQNIESDNLGTNIIGVEQLSGALRDELGKTLAQIRQYDASFRRNMQIISNVGTQVEALRTRMTSAEGSISDNADAIDDLGREDTALAELIALNTDAIEEVRQDMDTMHQQIIDALEALDTAVQDILAAMQPEPEPEPDPDPEPGGEENNQENGGEGE